VKRFVMAMTLAATSLTLGSASAQEAAKAPTAAEAPKAPSAPTAPVANAAPAAPRAEDALKTAPKAEDRTGAAPKPEDALKGLPKADDGHTPLGVRPSKPLTLAPESTSSGIGWKLAFAAAAVGLGVWGMRKRNAQKRNAPKHAIDIVSRKALGVRSELLVVTIDDQTFLLGVTPTSIGMLTTLTDPAGSEEAESRTEARDEEEPAPRAAASGALQSIATLFANRAALLPAKAEAPSEPPKSKPRTRRAATSTPTSATPTTSTSRRTLSEGPEKLAESSEGQLRGLLKKRSGGQ
jgi:flagellar biogenesis protein FliO